MSSQYGVDALRMAVIVGNLPGNDSTISEEKIRGYRNFANKIWNAARFVLTNCPSPSGGGWPEGPGEGELTAPDKAILKELETVAKEATKLIEKYDFAHAAENLYHYFWHNFADKIIEESKSKLANPETKKSAQAMLIQVLETNLKLLHPFMPFVTEAVWQLNHKDLLMIQKWPTK
jgi:valyl-tRNA synthetase